MSQASAGQAGEFGILGRERIAGFVPFLIVLEDLMTTIRPVSLEVMLWGLYTTNQSLDYKLISICCIKTLLGSLCYKYVFKAQMSLNYKCL